MSRELIMVSRLLASLYMTDYEVYAELTALECALIAINHALDQIEEQLVRTVAA